MSVRPEPGQFARYALVGIVSNACLYSGYLVLTWAGMGHKLAMTLLYAVGVAQTFALNRRWTFDHRGAVGNSFGRYLIASALGYAINYVGLYWMVDIGGMRHEYVQAAMIVLVAIVLFALQRYWVFQRERPKAAAVMPGR